MNKKTTLQITFCALFAALTAVLSQFSIPIGSVPINLATFSFLLAGSILGARYGMISQLLYVLLGAVGLPVFAGFNGGLHVLAGPTGGYIFGYVAGAWLVGFLVNKCGVKIFGLIGSMILGMLLCYTLGTAWFVFLTKTKLWAALTMCVFPFLIGDAAKIAAAAILTPRLKTVYGKMTSGKQV